MIGNKEIATYDNLNLYETLFKHGDRDICILINLH